MSPNIRELLKLRFEVEHYITQFLTGHGNLYAYLKMLGLKVNELCGECGERDTPELVMYDSTGRAESRNQFDVALAGRSFRFALRKIIRQSSTLQSWKPGSLKWEKCERLGRGCILGRVLREITR